VEPNEKRRLLEPSPLLRLLDRPVLFTIVVTLLFGLLGAAGFLGGRISPQPFPSGLRGLVIGSALGLVAGTLFQLLKALRLRRP
jgi:hypothetical protein